MSMFTKFAYGAASVALLAAAPAAVYAQQTSAQLRGSVVDASGAPVSGATITIMSYTKDVTIRAVEVFDEQGVANVERTILDENR